MKRTLTVLPLIAILLGVAIYVSRKTSEAPGTTQRPAGSPGVPLAPTPPAAAKSDAKTPAATPSAPMATGSIRFIVTLRGQPVPDAQITVQKVGTDEFMRFKTEADGTQFLHGLAPGDYGYGIRQDDTLPNSARVLVGPGQAVVINAELKMGARVVGTVTDRSGRPLPATRVLPLNEATKFPSGEGTVTDDKGQYALKGLPPGSLALRFRHDEFKPLDRLGLYLRSATEELRLDVTLEVGARLSGRVVDDAGTPIEGATVIAGNADSAGLTKSEKDGSFVVTGLTDYPSNISAAKEGYGKEVRRNLAGNTSDILFRLSKAGTVIGRLLIDLVPRQTQINLSKYDEDLKQVIPVESQFFALPTTATFAIKDVPAGTYWVDVLVSDYEAVDRPQIVVVPGRTTEEVRITMRKKN